MHKGRIMHTRNVDVAVIGAGPAGLAAAIKSKEAGISRVAIIERAEKPGGLLEQCIHNGFGLHYFQEDMTGPEYAHRFIEKAADLRVEMQLESMVLNISPDRRITFVNRKDGLVTLTAGAIVLAMGCRERTGQAIMLTGTRPAGIFTAGTAQRYINVEGFIPGKEVVILGSGDVGMIMARRLSLEGVVVKAVVEVLPYVGGLIRNEVQCLRDFDIPLMLGHTVTEVHGQDRVEAVTVAKVDRDRQPVAGTAKKIGCDTLLLSVGLIPENELSRIAGIELDPLVGGPVVDETMQTSVAGIFAGGNVVHVHDLVDNVTREAELAGEGAASYVSGRIEPGVRKIMVRSGENISYVVPYTITGDREVTLYARVKEPEVKVVIKAGNIFSKSLKAVKPSEMLNIGLTMKELEKMEDGVNELVVSCAGKGQRDAEIT